MSWMDVSSPIVPKIQLVGYDRPHLGVNKKTTLTFTVKSEQMAYWVDDTTGFKVMPGKCGIMA